jgi:hypothetical protein
MRKMMFYGGVGGKIAPWLSKILTWLGIKLLSGTGVLARVREEGLGLGYKTR